VGQVHLYKWTESTADGFELKQECEHGGHILALYLAARGDFIVVGDLMKSISLLVYKPVDGRIEEVRKPTSLSHIKDYFFLSLNVLTTCCHSLLVTTTPIG